MSRLPGARGPLGDLLSDLYYESVPLVTFNILWLLLTLPVVTAFPAVGGLVYATNQMAHDKHVTWRTFMAGFRAYFWTSWRWGLMNLLVVGMLVANVAFYRQIDAAWAQVAQLFFTAGIVVWLLVQLYTLPLLIEQAERNLREALRNSLVVWLRRPGQSIALAGATAALLFISTTMMPYLWLFITASLIAYMASRTTISAIRRLAR